MHVDESLNILLVDDDDADRLSIRRALRAAHVAAEVRETGRAGEALELMRSERFDCVLMDYGLADRDGLSMLREARADGMKSPIIILTGQGDEQLAVEIMKAGASDYLPKSRISLDRLVQSIRTAVRLHKTEEKMEAAICRMAESEERYRSLVFTTSQIVWTTDASGAVVTDLPTWRAFTGQTMEQVMGMGWLNAIHPEDRQATQAMWTRAVMRREQYECGYRLCHHDGTYRHIVARGTAVIGTNGAVREWVGTCKDVTDRIAAEQERARLLAHERAARADAEEAQLRLAFLADASKVLAASLDFEQTLATVVQLAVPRMADWCSVEILGSEDRLEQLAAAHADPAKAGLVERLRKGYPPMCEGVHGAASVIRTGIPQLFPEIPEEVIRATAHDAEHLELIRELGPKSAMIVALETRGQRLGAITFIAAESGRRFGAADLAIAEDLARRAAVAVDNARLYRHMCHAKDDAEAANRAKDQFLAVLSHELRTPLTPVLMTVQDLESDRNIPGSVHSALRMVRRNVELEARLIDDLLDLTRISKGKLQLVCGTVDAHALLDSALEICEADIVGKRQQVEVELGAERHHVGADSGRVQQVLWNLIKNAVKFTPEEGRIAIRTENDQAGNLRIRFMDSGVGIEADVLPRIFDAFEQGEQCVTRRFGGLGLGLAISKALVEAHGGQIEAQSEGRGMGATFTVHLPTIAAPIGQAAPTEAPGGESKPAHWRILLVDDHDDTTRAMKRLLERIGYEVRTASTVADALESARSGPFDLLISDIGLPDGSGMDLVRKLKESIQLGRPLKAIAISGFGMDEDVKKSREAGFMEHLIKPVNFQHLEEVMQKMAESTSGGQGMTRSGS